MARKSKRGPAPSPRRCKELLRVFADYLDGELPAKLCRDVERHLRRCKTCDCVVETLKKTITLYAKLPEVPLPHRAHEQLMRVLKKNCLK